MAMEGEDKSVRSFFAAALKRAGAGPPSTFSWDAGSSQSAAAATVSQGSGSGSSGGENGNESKPTARVRKAWASWIEAL